MTSTPPTHNNQSMETVHYDKKASAANNDGPSVFAFVPGCRDPSNSNDFSVLFSTNQNHTSATTEFMKTHYPYHHIAPYEPANNSGQGQISHIGDANITVYIPGHLEIPSGLRAMGHGSSSLRREEWLFRFDLKVTVMDAVEGEAPRVFERIPDLVVGKRDLRGFGLKLVFGEEALLLRDGQESSTRGVMPVVAGTANFGPESVADRARRRVRFDLPLRTRA